VTSPYFDDRFIDTTHRISHWLHWPLMLLGLMGACLPWWRAQQWGLSGRVLVAARIVSLIVFYAIGLHMIGAPYPRYGIPFRPLLYPLALLGLTSVVGLIDPRRQQPALQSLSNQAPDRVRDNI
jgi:hypothetical protein